MGFVGGMGGDGRGWEGWGMQLAALTNAAGCVDGCSRLR